MNHDPSRRGHRRCGAIGVIVNPHSRRNRGKNGVVSEFGRIVGDHGVVAECGDPDSLRRTAEDFLRKGIDVLAVGGGDGTNSVVLTTFREVYGDHPLPRLALLRGGTMNTIANGAGVERGKTAQLLEKLCGDIEAGRELVSVERGTMDIGGRLGFLFGVGLVEAWLTEYYKRGRPHVTPMTAVETLLVSVGSALIRGKVVKRIGKRPVLGLDIDGEMFPVRDYLTIAAGTCDQVGLGFRPFFRAMEDFDRFHVLAITCSAASFVGDLPLIRQGKPMREGQAIDRLVRAITIRSEDGSPVRFMVDGDIDERPSPLVVQAGPRVQVVTGAQDG